MADRADVCWLLKARLWKAVFTVQPVEMLSEDSHANDDPAQINTEAVVQGQWLLIYKFSRACSSEHPASSPKNTV